MVAPVVVIVGCAGFGETVTTLGSETREVQPLAVTLAVKVPAVFTQMEGVVAPVLQMVGNNPPAMAVSRTESPSQIPMFPKGEMVGFGGAGVTVTTITLETLERQLAVKKVRTVKVPLCFTQISRVLAPLLHW